MKQPKSYLFQESSFVNSGFFEVVELNLSSGCANCEEGVSDHYKIFWIEEGSGHYLVDFKEIEIKSAGLFFLSPGQIFTVKTKDIVRAYQISFDKEFYCVETHGKEIACNGILFNNVHKSSYIEVDPSEIPVFTNIINNIIYELQQPGSAHKEMLDSYLRILLVQALRRSEQDKMIVENPSEAKSKLAADFIALVEKNFRTYHSVSEYAKLLFVAPKTLSKRLKAEKYATPLQIIKDRIILQAKRDLRYTSKSIKEIAFDLGFEDPGYFTRLFKKSTSLAPQQYRNEYLN